MAPFLYRAPWILAATALVLVGSRATAQDRPAPSPPWTVEGLESSWQKHKELEASSPFHGLSWRSVGPVGQGGRVVDVEVVPGEPYTMYVAYASGGLWKTANNGGTFEPLFDQQGSMIIGDIALDPQDSSVIWVGTGEENSSRSSYGGMGIYRSGDGGATWEHKGLTGSDRIGEILVDPRDSDRVYVAVLGKLYTPGGPRGIYRTINGGESWQQVFTGAGAWTGFLDLEIDPSNPDVIYASSWERSRRPWDFVEGGDGSGIFKSINGGTTWARLEGGLPRGPHVGRIALAVARSQPQTLYASIDNQEELPEADWDLGDNPLSANRLRTMDRETFLEQDPQQIDAFVRGNDLDTSLDGEKLIEMIESEELTMDDLRAELADANANLFNTNIRGLELWRSDDAGATWRRTHDEPIRNVVFTYGYYFGSMAVAPDDPERVYLAGVPIIGSTDGGATFTSLQDPSVHVEYHPIWIDPENPSRMVVGNDGGIDVSYDRGETWFGLDAQPVGQFYAITLDNADPYNVYGGLQDNGSLKGSSQTRWELGERWQFIGGGDGMYVQVDPRNDDTLYTGFQFGFYQRAGKAGRATVRPRDELKAPALRYNWMTPIQLSPHSAEILYFGTNILYRSMDQGETWTAISPDMTHSEKRGDVPFGTISTLSESPKTFGLIWVGTDDGQVHVTEDGGVTWRDAAAGLPADRWVSRVETSSHARDTVFVSLNGYRDDDITPYLYRSDDLGATWRSIADGLPAEAINVVREDPVVADLLYVGTDRGVYVSYEGGGAWQALDAELPNVPVHDLAIHRRERELVAGTHGRSIWIVDVLPVQELASVREEPVHLFPVESVQSGRGWRSRPSQWFDRPEYLPEIDVPFWSAAAGTLTFEVLDGDERVLYATEVETRAGVGSLTWDLLLDKERALAAERARLAADDQSGDGKAADEPKGKKRKKQKAEEMAEDDSPDRKGHRAKTPYAEAERLGWRFYPAPGDYTLRLTTAEGATSETDFTIDAPEAREPRMKKEAPIRGRDDD